MKKALVLILTLLAVLSLFTGCGQNAEAPAKAVSDMLDNLKTSDAAGLKDLLLGSYGEDSEEVEMFESFDLSLFYKNLDYKIVSSKFNGSDEKVGTVTVKVTNTDFSLLMADWADKTIMAIAEVPEDISMDDFNDFLFKKSGEILAELLASDDYKTATKTFEVTVKENAEGVWEITEGLDPNSVLIGLDDFSNALTLS